MNMAIHGARSIGLQGFAFLALIFPASAIAQEDRSEVPPPLDPPPIVVFGDSEEDAPDAPRVIVGSRIPQEPLIQDGPVATHTGTPGFVPQSGMDPAGRYIRVRKRETCVADAAGISEEVACILLAAEDAAAEGDSEKLRGLLLPVATDPERSEEERSTAAFRLWKDARLNEDDRRIEEALLAMVEYSPLAPELHVKTWVELARLSRSFGEHEAERERLEMATKSEDTTPNALARLAIIQREAGEEQASATMQRALAILDARGVDAPPGWREFAAQ